MPDEPVRWVQDLPDDPVDKVARVIELIDAYREIGHYLADLDPLNSASAATPTSTCSPTGSPWPTSTGSSPSAGSPQGAMTLRDLIGVLRDTYCRTIGVEYMHIRNPSSRDWLQERMEPIRNRPHFDLRQKRRIIYKLNAAELFETFLHTNYVGQKRFSLEGGEMLIPLLDAIIERSASIGVREIVLGMPHRGRLNVLANILTSRTG